MSPVAEIVEFLEAIAPLTIAETWDNVGLIVGHSQATVSKVMTCLTVTPDVVQEAVDEQVQLLVTHHPMLFKPVQRLVGSDLQGAMLLKLIEAKIAVYSPHTAFDNATAGINQHWADLFHLQEIQPLRMEPNSSGRKGPLGKGQMGCAASTHEGLSASLVSPSVGSGRYGVLPSPVTLAEFCDMVKSTLQVRYVQRIGVPERNVVKIGIACGAAAEFIPDALQHGCHVLLTGEARFHDCLRARDAGLAMVLPGHYATERSGIEYLARTIQSEFPALRVFASRSESDPVETV